MTSFWWMTVFGTCLLATSISALVHITNGESGESCGPFGKKCLLGQAVCDNSTNTCKCNPPLSEGQGDVKCYKSNTVRAEVENDPDVHTFTNVSLPLPLPCRFPLTHVLTNLKNRKRKVVGSCDFYSHAFHQKTKGKFYLAGFDFAINARYFNGTQYSASIRIYGRAYNGSYIFIVNGTDNAYLPDGVFGSDVINFHDPDTNLKIQIKFDNDNNLAYLKSKKCGLDIQFRPYDLDLGINQPQIPHLGLCVNCAFHPQWKSLDNVMALPPPGNQLEPNDILKPGLNMEESLIVRALAYNYVQNSPEPNPECSVAHTNINNCSAGDLPVAMKSCMFILQHARFINCYDKTESGEDIMGLFADCIKIYCGAGDCNRVIQKITDSSCDNLSPPYPDVVTFVSGTECPKI